MKLIRSALVLAAITATSSAVAQNRVILPAGTVIIVRTTSPLESATAQTGQSFETTVEESIGVDEYTVIPGGSRIRGTISAARPATRQQSGVIEVIFDQLRLADGTTIAISGTLTSTDSAERRQIKSNPNARVALIGARGGIGAAIAGAGAGKGTNNLLSALGGLLSEGRDVSLAAGTPLAVEIQRAVSLRGGARMRGGDASTIYTALERVRGAQQALARLNYYRGPITGRLDDATRRALFQFQADRRLNATGNLDGRTASELGINLALGGANAGAVLTADQASTMRRSAQGIVSQYRNELGISDGGRVNMSRQYAQPELELWFAVSAFADNAALYEQLTRTNAGTDAAVLAGRALVSSARRVDAAMQAVRVSNQLQNAWSSMRRTLAPLDGGT